MTGRAIPGDEGAPDIVGRTGEEMPEARHAGLATPAQDAARATHGPASWGFLALWVGGCLAGGLAGSLVGDPRSAWFRALDTPSWQPPDAIFGPVWTLLYLSMGVAAWRVWRLGRPTDIAWFLVQLALNFAWAPLFFGAQRVDLAFVTIVALWCALAVVVLRFWRVDRAAAALLVPYFAWVTFAAALNLEILRRNS